MRLLLPPPLVVLLLAGLMWLVNRTLNFDRFSWPLQLPLAGSFLVLGITLMVAAATAFVRHKTTVNPMKPANASRLITTGIFSFSRNPIYLGDLLLLAALAIGFGHATNFALLPLFVLYINRFQIEPEEAALTKLFGASYMTYQAQVRRWI